MNRHSRLNALLELVLERENVHIDEIVSALGVSPATARRDLEHLAQQQLITRTRGGASTHPGSSDLPLRYKTGRHAEQKAQIARAAAAMVSPGDVVGLNGGTTTTEIAREIAVAPALQDDSAAQVVVVTNAVNIANELTVRPQVRVVVTGGVARSHSYELTGPLALLILNEVSIDTLFLGVNAFDAAGGAAAHHDGEAAINAAFVEVARRVVVVADSSKLGQTAFARICPTRRVDALLTDSGADRTILAAIEAAGVEVIIA